MAALLGNAQITQLLEACSLAEARNRGWLRSEGKEHLTQEGGCDGFFVKCIKPPLGMPLPLTRECSQATSICAPHGHCGSMLEWLLSLTIHHGLVV
jgi:hypothetical protein